MGPVTWTVINEVFPGHIRGRAVAVATAVNWGSAFLVSQSFLSLIGAMGNSLTFWLFALFCVRRLDLDLLPCAGDQGTVAGTDPATLEGGALMLIAGDIGGTTTRLALVSPDAGPRKFVAEQEFHSADYEGLQPIVEAFLAKTGDHATSACFDVAGPVIERRAHLTNLPWDLEEAALCRDLGLQRVSLLNDLRAIAHAVPHLRPEETVAINAGRPWSMRRSRCWRRAPGSARRS